MSSIDGESSCGFFCVTKKIFLFISITDSSALIDLSLPTKSGVIIPGNTTISLNGSKGIEKELFFDLFFTLL